MRHRSARGLRPRCLVAAALAALAPALPGRLTPAARAATNYLGVMSGDMTTNDAILWTRATDSVNGANPLTLTAQVSTDPTFGSVAATYAGATSPANDFTLKLDATGLAPGTKYYYRFVDAANAPSNVGTFKTAYAPTRAAPVHFGFSGDYDGQWRPYSASLGIPPKNLDFYVSLGDNLYESANAKSAGTADPFANPTQALADYHRKSMEQFVPVNPGGQPGLKQMYAGQGQYTLLDNHELGNKQFINGGAPPGTPPGKGVDATNPANDVNTTGAYINQTTGFKTVQKAYNDYQPIKTPTVVAPSDPRSNGTQQMYSAQQWGRNALFVNVDDRSYRDIRMKTAGGADDTGPRGDNPARTMLGATELNWLEKTLSDAQKAGTPWKFVAISSPIDQIGAIGSGADGGKSWMGQYRAERNALMKFIADNHIGNVVFLTTDDHQNRVNELLYSPTGDTANQASYVKVPGNVFQIVDGPLGAGGPDAITDHSFANLKNLADSLAAQQKAAGVDPIGLDPNFPVLHNLVREGDPNADTNRQPIDFYSPDTFNYNTLDVSADGSTLTVTTWGINSYPANTFPEASGANAEREILSFQVTAAVPLPAAAWPGLAALAALAAWVACRRAVA